MGDSLVQPIAPILMFRRCCQLLADYIRAELQLADDDFDRRHTLQDRFGEAYQGLRHLSFIIDRMKDLDTLARGIHTDDAIVIEIQVLAEAFYYKAWRVQRVINLVLPTGLKHFKCRGVRDVRNKLLEHPESSSSGVVTGGFAFGGVNGPTLKHGRPVRVPTAFPDAGLYINAEEYRRNLESTLESVIARARA